MRHNYLKGDTAVKIAEAIEAAIRDGSLCSGDRILSVREASALLAVNRNTVAAAYARLRDAGVLLAGGGRTGMRVAATEAFEGRPVEIPDGVVDLASGNVDARYLPKLEQIIGQIDLTPTGYDVEGDDPALVSFAQRTLGEEGLDTTHMCFVSGAMDAIERAMRTQVRPGSTVLVEDPGFPPLFELLRSLGLKLRPIPVDSEGPDAEAISEGLAAGASAVVLTPRAQNPYGCDISADRAARISEVISRHPQTLLILDDHWGPLAEGALELRPDSAERWLFIRSVSKFLGPDYRLAVVLGDGVTIGRIRRQQALGPRWVSRLLQRFVHALWTSKQTANLLEEARNAYRARRNALSDALTAEGLFPQGWSGIHLWVPVAGEAQTIQSLLAHGWAVQPGEAFRISSPTAIRLSIVNLDLDQVPILAKQVALAARRAGTVLS